MEAASVLVQASEFQQDLAEFANGGPDVTAVLTELRHLAEDSAV